MSEPITTKYGEAVPPAPRHSVTVHVPGWANLEKFGADPSGVIASFKNAYPRMKPHPDIARLSEQVLKHIGATDEHCLLFSSLQSARECVQYATSPRRDDGKGKKPVPADQISMRCFTAKDRFYAVIFAPEHGAVASGFWKTPGAGVSSRFGEANLAYVDQLAEVSVTEDEAHRPSFNGPGHGLLRERIVSLLQRATNGPPPKSYPSAGDVYFFQTGMASIYKPHTYMFDLYQGTTVLFGMAFMNTLGLFEEFTTNWKFCGLGTDEDIKDLRAFLEEERSHGRKVQTIWAEFPANPLLHCPDIHKLRALADEFDVVLALDDTIGSWANIDILSQADFLVTSLTKSFNGYADVIAGSVILNPESRKYAELKPLFDKHHVPELYIDDADAIVRNSRDYLARTAKHNSNAAALVDYLGSCAADPGSAVSRVYYPSVNASGKYYKSMMRKETPELTPGYGCLLNVEFCNLDATKAFYECLNVHKGPHLGAPFTLVFGYTVVAYGTRLDWAAQYGLKPTQIRIAAGHEDIEVLLKDFKEAIDAANAVSSNGTCIDPS